ncbi:MAG: class I SAM-dependent methyltransferase [Chloroflexi bacterium]|nr:class I SAM-dependent methyltransferase [Chloroflexota bacterium]
MRRRFTPALAFDLLTPLYDRVNDLLGFGKPFMRRVADLANVGGGEIVLDVGGGTGSLLLEMLSRNPRLEFVGMDPDRKTLQVAQGKFRRAGVDGSLVQGEAQELPFCPCSVDLVTSTLIFHHLPTGVKQRAIEEIRRVLRPGGRFILADFGKPQTITTEALI